LSENSKREKPRFVDVTNRFGIVRSFLRSRIHALLDNDPVHPMFVHFECTYRCNMRCAFCNIWQKNLYPTEASTAELKQRLWECWDLGCALVSFTGGEPLLRSDLGELVNYSGRDLGLFTGLVTNGLLIDKKLNELRNLDILTVSFDVDDRELFNRTRGVDAFRKVKENIRLAKRSGLEPELLSVITRETLPFMDDTLEFAKSLELHIHFSPVDTVPREFMEASEAKNLKLPNPEAVLAKLKEAKKDYKKLHFEKDYFRFQAMGGFGGALRCSSASTTVSLKPDAAVALPCPFFTIMSIKKGVKLRDGLKTERAQKIIDLCGTWCFCESCSVNCMYVASLTRHPRLLVKWLRDKL